MSTTLDLLPQHQQQLVDSGISDEVAIARGYRSITTKADLRRLGFGVYQCNVPGLLIPIWGVTGAIENYHLRPDAPRIKDGKPLKYEMPGGSRMLLDIHPSMQGILRDASVPLIFTEGAKKVDAGLSQGLSCIGLPGVWGFRGRNEYGGTSVLGDLESLDLRGRVITVIFDSDVIRKREVYAALVRLVALLRSRGATVRIGYLPHGEDGRKVGLDDFLVQHPVEALWQYVYDDLREPPQEAVHPTGPYVAQNNRLYFVKRVGEDAHDLVPLANFVATIVEEVVADDGATERGELLIDGVHASGRPLPPIRVPLHQFGAMNWPTTQWGTQAIVAAGMGSRDRLREAIQIFSPDVPRRREYGHSGWRQIDGQWVYLHAGGGIGADGVVEEIEVRLSGDLDHLVLPVPPEGADLHAACRASLSVLDLAPDRIIATLHGAAYRAPTNELAPADLSVFLSGFTGRFKTELGALAQQHFGAGWSRTKLPASWEATANALERIAFEAKDAVVLIDDFVPGGSQQRISEMNAKADRVLRGAGNRSARARMSADGRLRPDYPPRGTIVATGEEIPRGQSLRARLAVVEIARGDVNLDRLTTAQADGAAGMFAAATAGYVRWLAPRMDDLRASIGAELSALRTAALASGTAHSRTPDVTANLCYGWKQFLAFCLSVGAIDPAEHDRLWDHVWTALCTLAREQAGIQKTEDQTYRYLDLMLTAVASQQAHVANMDGHAPAQPQVWGWEAVPTHPTSEDGRTYTEYEYRPKGPRIGWLDAETLYLLPAASLSAVQKIAATNGAAIGLSERTLGARLHERGALVAGGKGGYTVPRTVERGKQRVFAISRSYLTSHVSDTSDIEGAMPHGDAENPYRIGGNTSDTSDRQGGISDTGSDDPIPSQLPIRTEPVEARANTAVSDASDNPDTIDAMEQKGGCTPAPTRAADAIRASLAANGEGDA